MAVTESDQSSSTAFADQRVRDVVRQVADPGHNSGGGVVVGLTLAGAAASAELVLQLAAKRKSLASRRAEIVEILESVAAARRSFESAPDRDIAAFEHLVQTQREIKRLPAGEQEAARERLNSAYLQAAGVPLGLAREALELMRLAERGLPFASRFTASDIGAAAALARGALEAALLTVDANLSYLEDDVVASLLEEMSAMRAEAVEVAERVLQAAHDAITKPADGS